MRDVCSSCQCVNLGTSYMLKCLELTNSRRLYPGSILSRFTLPYCRAQAPGHFHLGPMRHALAKMLALATGLPLMLVLPQCWSHKALRPDVCCIMCCMHIAAPGSSKGADFLIAPGVGTPNSRYCSVLSSLVYACCQVWWAQSALSGWTVQNLPHVHVVQKPLQGFWTMKPAWSNA